MHVVVVVVGGWMGVHVCARVVPGGWSGVDGYVGVCVGVEGGGGGGLGVCGWWWGGGVLVGGQCVWGCRCVGVCLLLGDFNSEMHEYAKKEFTET